MDKLYHNSLEEAIDRNLELTELLTEKLKSFEGKLMAVTIGMAVILLVQVAMVIAFIY